MFSASASMNVYNIFTVFSRSKCPSLIKGIIFSLTRSDSWVSTVVQTLNTKISHHHTAQKQYRDLFDRVLQLPTKQIVDTVRWSGFGEPQELYIPNQQGSRWHPKGRGHIYPHSLSIDETKSTWLSAAVGGFNTMNCTLVVYMTFSSLKRTKITYKSLPLVQTSKLSVLISTSRSKQKFLPIYTWLQQISC